MDDPDPLVIRKADPAGLTAARSKRMQTAITTVEHCLGLWHSFIAAATNHPLHIAVTTPDDPDSDTAPAVSAHLDTDQGHLHLQVPRSLVDEPPSRLAARILDVVVPAIVVHAENHPHEQPPAFWVSTQAWQPPADEPEPGIRLEDLLDGDALLIARHDGTPAGADSRERTLDDYLCEQLESPGIAVRDGALTTDTTLSWTLELLNSD